MWTWDLLLRWLQQVWQLCRICRCDDPVDIRTDLKNTHKHTHTWKHSLTGHLLNVCLWPPLPLPSTYIQTTVCPDLTFTHAPQGLEDKWPHLTQQNSYFYSFLVYYHLTPSCLWGLFFLLNGSKTQMVESGFEHTNMAFKLHYPTIMQRPKND